MAKPGGGGGADTLAKLEAALRRARDAELPTGGEYHVRVCCSCKPPPLGEGYAQCKRRRAQAAAACRPPAAAPPRRRRRPLARSARRRDQRLT
jgi:hypothetical protein